MVDARMAEVGSVTPDQSPTRERWLGTDSQGRDVLTVIALGTRQTVKIGLIAGALGIGVGLVLGLVSGVAGGRVDTAIRVGTDTLMTVPVLAILVVIAANVEEMTVELMGITVACLAWVVPTRTIRAQVLSLRHRAYVDLARANGESDLGIAFREILPNIIPYILASFVAAVGAGILAAVGLEALGLGANSEHTLGTTIYWAERDSAVLRGLWWWWGPPIIMIVLIFLSLFLTAAGLDRVANPRLRTR
jgi:peptide/nickel transport system permease protein